MHQIVRIAAVAATLLLSGCGNFHFVPAEYPLRAGLINTMPARGQTKFVNAQPSTADVTVYSYGGSSLSSDLHAITETMANQAARELAKAAQPAAGPDKTVDLKVTSLLSEYQIAFHWKSTIQFEAHLGDGQVLALTVHHASGDLRQDLDGCIAEGVMTLLNDPRFQAYVAR